LFFYCTSVELQERFKRTGTCLDLLPTATNLRGFEVDTHQMLGRDLFDPDYHGFFFVAWEDLETDDYIYSSVKDEWTMMTNGCNLSLAEEEIYYSMEMQEVSSEIFSWIISAMGKASNSRIIFS
jgi:phosphoglycerol transferase MdoB-like AlkP superfamily enzyme